MNRPIATLSSEALQRNILDILCWHIGRKKSIKRDDIIHELAKRGLVEGVDSNTERRVRDAIHELRNQGHIICSVAAGDGGYFIAAEKDEVFEFIDTEIQPRINDLSKTKKAILDSARKQFGNTQIGLF